MSDLTKRASETWEEWLDRTCLLLSRPKVTVTSIGGVKVVRAEGKPIFTALDVIRAHAMGVEL